MTKILTGLQPTGTLHIGNYLGSIQQFHRVVNSYENSQAVLFIADQHSITVKNDPEMLRNSILELVAVYLASGLDYSKHLIFSQSSNPDHAYVAWHLMCMTPMGWLDRMTQYKDKKAKVEDHKESVSTGLYTYPVLMAADILLYDVDIVPVGVDQVQHVEITRDLATRFNSAYGETFNIPEFKVSEVVAKIQDLQNPEKKMSKSDINDTGRIMLTDTPEVMRKKIMKSVTDSENVVSFDRENKAGVSNLLAIMSVVTNSPIDELAAEYETQGYGKFKSAVADAVIEYFSPIQEKMRQYLEDKGQLMSILDDGAKRAQEITHPKAIEVANKMGMYAHE